MINIHTYFFYSVTLDWNKELITEPRPTMEIPDDDLLDIGTGKQKLEDFISKIICHSTKNEFAVGKNHPYSIPFRILLSINKSTPCIFFKQ